MTAAVEWVPIEDDWRLVTDENSLIRVENGGWNLVSVEYVPVSRHGEVVTNHHLPKEVRLCKSAPTSNYPLTDKMWAIVMDALLEYRSEPAVSARKREWQRRGLSSAPPIEGWGLEYIDKIMGLITTIRREGQDG